MFGCVHNVHTMAHVKVRCQVHELVCFFHYVDPKD